MNRTPAKVVPIDTAKRIDELIRDAPDEAFELYSIAEMARMCGWSYERMRQAIYGEMEHVKLGPKRIGVRKPIFRRWMMERTKGRR